MAVNPPRVVVPELLDGLAPRDPRARRSRADLRRIHRAMASLTIMRRALRRATDDWQPQTLLEIGAGDGSLMLRLGECQAQYWPQLSVTLVDRVDVVEPHTLDGLRRLGWHPQALTADVFDWLATARAAPGTLSVRTCFCIISRRRNWRACWRPSRPVPAYSFVANHGARRWR